MAKSVAEPSVEEILASIKKVIAQEGREAALSRGRDVVRSKPKPAKPATSYDHADGEADDENVLELTDDFEPDAEEDALVSADKRNAMRESLAVLSTLSEPGAAPRIVQSGETSLEAMVRDMLRPMLAQWLDENLPNLVETMVAKEISKITRKG